jgi:hypothetical protein
MIQKTVLIALFILAVIIISPLAAHALPTITCPDGTTVTLPPGSTYNQVCAGHTATTQQQAQSGHACGSGKNGEQQVVTAINIGCQAKGNPIMDMLFAFIRVLTTGVGLVIVGSLVYAGIQYSASRGDPQNTAKAISRIQANVIALLIFIFGYAFLNYLIPGAVLK